MHVQYGWLFNILKRRKAANGLPGSGISTFFHKKQVRIDNVLLQCLAHTAHDALCQPLTTHGAFVYLMIVLAQAAVRLAPFTNTISASAVQGQQPVQVQCLTFDEPYQKLVPPEAR